ncbi:MAG: type II secretion system protein, partial [Planctomycetota bacterium]
MSTATRLAEQQAWRIMQMRSRKGLTLLEVIFSMVVLLVGLVAIVFLIPLAGREAEDSQQITQGLAAGESALAMFTTTSVAQPTLESPWCLVDDIGSVEHSVATMRDAFNAAARTFPVPPNAVQAAIAQNEA